jgi:hypothetical protein
VQTRHREDAEQCRLRVVAREGQRVRPRRGAGDEAEHADEEKHRADRDGGVLHRSAVPTWSCGWSALSSRCGHGGAVTAQGAVKQRRARGGVTAASRGRSFR